MQAISEEMVRCMKLLEPKGDVTDKLEQLIRAEARRRLNRYKRIDNKLSEKYGMSFEEFKKNKIVAEKGYSFEVESDFWDWELARDGIETMQEILQELKRLNEKDR